MDPAGPCPGHLRSLNPGYEELGHAKIVHRLYRTLTVYLDSQQKWKEFESAKHGLSHLLCYISASMGFAEKALLGNLERALVVFALSLEQCIYVLGK